MLNIYLLLLLVRLFYPKNKLLPLVVGVRPIINGMMTTFVEVKIAEQVPFV